MNPCTSLASNKGFAYHLRNSMCCKNVHTEGHHLACRLSSMYDSTRLCSYFSISSGCWPTSCRTCHTTKSSWGIGSEAKVEKWQEAANHSLNYIVATETKKSSLLADLQIRPPSLQVEGQTVRNMGIPCLRHRQFHI